MINIPTRRQLSKFFRDYYRIIQATVLVLVPILLTSAYGLYSDYTADKKQALILTLVLANILSVLAGVVFAYLWFLKYARRKKLSDSQKCIPTIISFNNRTDVIKILDENGDRVELTLKFDIEARLKDNIQYMKMPIMFDVYDDTMVEKIQKGNHAVLDDMLELQAVSVDDVDRLVDSLLVDAEIRREVPKLTGTVVPYVYTYLQVPVELIPGVTRRRVEIRFIAKKAFKNIQTGESIYVDVHYLTRDVNVEVLPPAGYRVLGSPLDKRSPNVHASSYFTRTSDDKESRRVNLGFQQTNKRVAWKTDYPKLGYRYEVGVRIVKEAPATPVMPPATNPTPGAGS